MAKAKTTTGKKTSLKPLVNDLQQVIDSLTSEKKSKRAATSGQLAAQIAKLKRAQKLARTACGKSQPHFSVVGA